MMSLGSLATILQTSSLMLNDERRRKVGIDRHGSDTRTIPTFIGLSCHPPTQVINGSDAMIKQNDFSKGGMVSVWIGNLSSDTELDDYLDISRKFEKDFGFEINERDPPETFVNSTPAAIPELVNGFSWSKSYAGLVAELARKQGIEKATTMVVFFNLEYPQERATQKECAPLKFLGVVPFS